MISAWLRVIRVRFLLASVVAVAAGLACHWQQSGSVDIWHALLTAGGVLALHASVDLFNDYHDHRRGIDKKGGRTAMSGGTGVLPEGLLEPRAVYRAGIAFLALGAAAGAYFVAVAGWPIALILGFAVVSIYFYSTRIVDSGLAEVFVAAKGALIVAGTYMIQSGTLDAAAGLAGIIVGILSALVLFVASFPDHDADRAGGRRTLVIAAGKRRASAIFWAFPAAACAAVVAGIGLGHLPPACIVVLGALPLAVQAGRGLRRFYDDTPQLVPYMAKTMAYSRISGALLVIGLVAAGLPRL